LFAELHLVICELLSVNHKRCWINIHTWKICRDIAFDWFWKSELHQKHLVQL